MFCAFFFFKCEEGFYADCFKGILCFIVSEPGVHVCNKFKGNTEPYWCILKGLKDCSRARLFKSFQTEFRQEKLCPSHHVRYSPEAWDGSISECSEYDTN